MRQLLKRRMTKSGVRSFITMNSTPSSNDNLIIQVLTPKGLVNPFLRVNMFDGVDRLADKGLWVSLDYVDDLGIDEDIRQMKRDYPYFEEVVL